MCWHLEPPHAIVQTIPVLSTPDFLEEVFLDSDLASLRARAILVDMEEGVVNQLLRSSLGELFDPHQCVTDVSGAGNNWCDRKICRSSGSRLSVFRPISSFLFRPLSAGPTVTTVTAKSMVTVWKKQSGMRWNRVSRPSRSCCCTPWAGERALASVPSFWKCYTTTTRTCFGLQFVRLRSEVMCYGCALCCPCSAKQSVCRRPLLSCTAVMPSERDDVVIAPYNTTLAMEKLVEHADCVLPLANESLMRVCGRIDRDTTTATSSSGSPGKAGPGIAESGLSHVRRRKPKGGGRSGSAFDTMNNVAAHLVRMSIACFGGMKWARRCIYEGFVERTHGGCGAVQIANLTSSVRFEGSLNVDLNEVATNLVPFPRMNFLVPRCATGLSYAPSRGRCLFFADDRMPFLLSYATTA